MKSLVSSLSTAVVFLTALPTQSQSVVGYEQSIHDYNVNEFEQWNAHPHSLDDIYWINDAHRGGRNLESWDGDREPWRFDTADDAWQLPPYATARDRQWIKSYEATGRMGQGPDPSSTLGALLFSDIPNPEAVTYDELHFYIETMAKTAAIRETAVKLLSYNVELRSTRSLKTVEGLNARKLLKIQRHAPEAFAKVAPRLLDAYVAAIEYAQAEALGINSVQVSTPEKFDTDRSLDSMIEFLRGGLEIRNGPRIPERDPVSDAELYKDLLLRASARCVAPIHVDGLPVSYDCIDPHAATAQPFSLGPDAVQPGNRKPHADTLDSEPGPDGSSAETLTSLADKDCGPLHLTPCFDPAVSLHRDGAVACSGTLVAPTWVLTASHCVCNAAAITQATVGRTTPGRYHVPNLSPTEALATVATTSERYLFPQLPGEGGPTTFCSDLEEFEALPKLDADDTVAQQERLAKINSTFGRREVALIRLSGPLAQPIGFRHALLGRPDMIDTLRSPYVAGFGQNNWQRKGGDKTYMKPVLTAYRCEAVNDPSEDGCVHGQELVLRDPQGLTDSCYGDSGAGVFVRLTDSRLAVIALVSRGINAACGTGGIHPIVGDNLVTDWIRKVTAGAATVAKAQPELRFTAVLN